MNIDSLMVGGDLNTYYDGELGLPYSGPSVLLDESGYVYLKGWMKDGKRDGIWTYYDRDEGAEHSLSPFFDLSNNHGVQGFKTPWYLTFKEVTRLVIFEYELRSDTIYEQTTFSAPYSLKEKIDQEWKGVLDDEGEWSKLGSTPIKCANAETINLSNRTKTTGCFCDRNGANFKTGIFQKYDLVAERIIGTKSYRQGYLSGPATYYNYSDENAEEGGTRWEYNYTSPWLDAKSGQLDAERRSEESGRNGPGQSYYIESGQLKEVHTWVDDKRRGPFVKYFSSGEVHVEGSYFDNSWTGTIIQRLRNGRVKYVSNWTNGVRDGRSYDFWFALDGTQGALSNEEMWEEGTKLYSIEYQNAPWENWKDPRVVFTQEDDGIDTPLEQTFFTSRVFSGVFVDFLWNDRSGESVMDDVLKSEEAWSNFLSQKIMNSQIWDDSGQLKSAAPCFKYKEETITGEHNVELCGLVLNGNRMGTWFYLNQTEEEILRPGTAPFISNKGDTIGLVLTWSKGREFEDERVKHGPSLLIDSGTNTLAQFTYQNNKRQNRFWSVRVEDDMIITEEGFYQDDVKNGPFRQGLSHTISPEDIVWLYGNYEGGERRYEEDRIEAIKEELEETKEIDRTDIMLDKYEIEIDTYDLSNWLNTAWEIEIANTGVASFFIDTILCHEGLNVFSVPEEIKSGHRGKLSFEISSEYMKSKSWIEQKSGLNRGKIQLVGNTDPKTTVITVSIKDN